MCFLLKLLYLYFSKYSFGLTAIVTIFQLPVLSISYKPTFFSVYVLRTLKWDQNSFDRSNLSNIFELIITSNFTFLESFSFNWQFKLQIKTNNKDVLSVSLKFWYKNIFLSYACYKSLALLNYLQENKIRRSYHKQSW